jgi:hypothetical protein
MIFGMFGLANTVASYLSDQANTSIDSRVDQDPVHGEVSSLYAPLPQYAISGHDYI